MAISYVGESHIPATENGINTGYTITWSSRPTMQQGDFVLVYVSQHQTTGTWSVTNTGGQTWTEVFDEIRTNNHALFWCIYNGTWSANPVFTCTGTSASIEGWMVVLRGVDQTNPWDVVVTTAADTNDQDFLTFNTNTNGAWAVWGGFESDDNTCTTNNGGSWASEGTTDVGWRVSADHTMAMCRKYIATAGATGATTLNYAANDPGGKWYGALKPATLPPLGVATDIDNVPAIKPDNLSLRSSGNVSSNYPHGAIYLNGKVFVSTNTAPAKVFRFNRPWTEPTDYDSVTFTNDTYHQGSIDLLYIPSKGKLYCPFGNTQGSGGRVAEIDPVALSQSDVITESTYYFGSSGMSITSDGTYLYVITYDTTPSNVIRYRLSDWGRQDVTALTGRTNGHAIRYDPVSGYVFATGAESPAWIARITPSDMSFTTTTFPTNYNLATDDMAFASTYVFVGLESQSGLIRRLSKTDFTSAIDSASNSGVCYGTFTDPDGQHIWSLHNTSPGTIILRDLNGNIIRTFTADASFPAPNEMAFDGNGHAFVTEWGTTFDVRAYDITGPSLTAVKRRNLTVVGETDSAEIFAGAGPTPVEYTVASETDTSEAFSKRKTKAFTQAEETDTSQVFGSRKTKVFVESSETDTSQAVASGGADIFLVASETGSAEAVAPLFCSECSIAAYESTEGAYAYVHAEEIDSGQSLTLAKQKAYTLTTEADTAETVTRIKTLAFNVASETDSSETFAKIKTKAYVLAPGTDTAQVLGKTKRVAYFVFEETDSAWRLTSNLGCTVETDSAMSIQAFGGLGTAGETDSAQVLIRRKTKAFTNVVESGTAQAVSLYKQGTLGVGSETDSASQLSSTKTKAYTQASETDSTRRLTKTVTRVLETDSAQQLVSGKTKLLVASTETDTAQRLTQNLGIAQETDSAMVIAAPGVLGRTEETDSAQTFGKTKYHSFTFATETDVAQTVDKRKWLTFNVATSADTAQSVSYHTGVLLVLAGEVDSAELISRRKVKSFGVATETDASYTVAPAWSRTLGLASESDSAQVLACLKKKDLGVTLEVDLAWRFFGTGIREILTAEEDDTAPIIRTWGAPRFLNAVAVSETRVDLTWTAVARVWGYQITRNGVYVATVQSPTTAYSDTGLNPATQYTYCVKSLFVPGSYGWGANWGEDWAGYQRMVGPGLDGWDFDPWGSESWREDPGVGWSENWGEELWAGAGVGGWSEDYGSSSWGGGYQSIGGWDGDAWNEGSWGQDLSTTGWSHSWGQGWGG